jgi:hypothetical protein
MLSRSSVNTNNHFICCYTPYIGEALLTPYHYLLYRFKTHGVLGFWDNWRVFRCSSFSYVLLAEAPAVDDRLGERWLSLTQRHWLGQRRTLSLTWSW